MLNNVVASEQIMNNSDRFGLPYLRTSFSHAPDVIDGYDSAGVTIRLTCAFVPYILDIHFLVTVRIFCFSLLLTQLSE